MKSARVAWAACAIALATAWPGVALAEVLTLARALALAEEHSPLLAVARENLSAAEHRVGKARAGYLPQASLSATYQRASSNFAPRPGLPNFNVPEPSLESFDYYQASASVSQLLYDFGRTGGAYDASRSEARAAETDVDAVREAVALTVTRTYFGVLASQQAMTAAQETRRQMDKHLELARGQVDAGLRPMIDVTRAKADLASANLAVVQAENQLAMAKTSLNTAIGIADPGADWVVEAPPPPTTPLPQSIDAAVTDALARRADLASQRARLESARETVRVARAGYFPALSANGSFTYAGRELPAMVYNWAGSLNLSWSFFSGFATRHEVDEMEARVRAAEANLRAFEVNIRNEVELAFRSYADAQEKIAPAQALLTAAQQTLELAEGRYGAGAGSIVEVTDAQAILTQAQVSAIAADFDLQTARAGLLEAVGRILPERGEAAP
jgi:outer membrane protein